MAGNNTCLCCGAPLTSPAARATKLCGNPVCAWKHRHTPAHQRCQICDRILVASQIARRLCASSECRQAWMLAQFQENERQREAELTARAAEWRDRLAAEVPDAAAFPIALVPYNPVVPIRLPEERRAAFLVNLTGIIAQAMAEDSPLESQAMVAEDAAPRQPDPALFHACAACRGRCCRNGQDHAYLTPGTIRRYLRASPGSSADDIAAHYMSLLPEENLEHGCVYQRTDGCALPRSLRSDTCNDYYCQDLKQFEWQLAADEPVRAFFVATDSGSIGQGVFVSPELVQLVRFDEAENEE